MKYPFTRILYFLTNEGHFRLEMVLSDSLALKRSNSGK